MVIAMVGRLMRKLPLVRTARRRSLMRIRLEFVAERPRFGGDRNGQFAERQTERYARLDFVGKTDAVDAEARQQRRRGFAAGRGEGANRGRDRRERLGKACASCGPSDMFG